MRLLSHAADGAQRLAVLDADGLAIDVAALLDGSPWTMERLLVDARSSLEAIAAALAARPSVTRRELSSLVLLPPVPRPGKIVAVGRNYREHAAEEGAETPADPILFAKFPTALIGDGSPITWRTSDTAQVDYEAELAIVIGRAARDVPVDRAFEHVLGYACLNDVSARDLQFGDGQWVRGKSLDSFCPMGPWIVTADELPDPGASAIRCIVNGEVRQSASTAELVHGVPELIAYCSRYMTLEPGDVIATGTPGGVGAFRVPPVFLADGDEVVVEIEGVGRLANRCRVLPG